MASTEPKTSNLLSKEMPLEVPPTINTSSVEQNVKESEKPVAPQPRMPEFVNDSLISRQNTFAYEEALQELFLNAE